MISGKSYFKFIQYIQMKDWTKIIGRVKLPQRSKKDFMNSTLKWKLLSGCQCIYVRKEHLFFIYKILVFIKIDFFIFIIEEMR